MGKQINYYMGYKDFLAVAQVAIDSNCTIYRRSYANGHWVITSGRTLDIVSENHRDYFFYDPQSGEIAIENKNKNQCISSLSRLNIIEAGFSIPNNNQLIRNRLYIITGLYDDGNWAARSESITKLYNKLVRIVKKVAPYTEFDHCVVNPMYEGELHKTKEYITPFYLSVVKTTKLKLG